MHLNDHVLPGDLLLTIDSRTQLYARHPADIGIGVGEDLWDDNGDLICNLQSNVPCFVLAVEPARSAGAGHVFFVMSGTHRIRFGWVAAWQVRSWVTQRESAEDRWDQRCAQVRW